MAQHARQRAQQHGLAYQATLLRSSAGTAWASPVRTARPACCLSKPSRSHFITVNATLSCRAGMLQGCPHCCPQACRACLSLLFFLSFLSFCPPPLAPSPSHEQLPVRAAAGMEARSPPRTLTSPQLRSGDPHYHPDILSYDCRSDQSQRRRILLGAPYAACQLGTVRFM